MRRNYFLWGLGTRLLIAAIFIITGQEGSAVNDMFEVIHLGLLNLVRGVNPYSTEYLLHWGSGEFVQPLNYGPITLLLFLPALLFPDSLEWIQCMWVGGFILNQIYFYLLAETLIKISSKDMTLQKYARINHSKEDPRENRNIYYAGLFLWVLPFGTMIVTVFLWAPMWLCLLAFIFRDRPFWSGFFISMAAMGYQLCFLFLPIYAIYLIKNHWKLAIPFALGCIPSVVILIIFELWPPGGAIYSIFLYTSKMGYVKCPNCMGIVDFLGFSIPKAFYEYSGGTIQIGNYARLAMFLILGAICLIYLFTKRWDKFPELFLNQYFILATVLFTLTTNYGGVHYLLFVTVPAIYIVQILKPDIAKLSPIGKGLKTYEDLEQYLLKNHRLPA